MQPATPMWRPSFDRLERVVGRQLEELVLTRAFNDLLALTLRAEHSTRRAFARQAVAVLHFWSLPARSDVTQLARQVGALTSDVQELAQMLENDQRQRQRRGRPAADGGSSGGRAEDRIARCGA